MKICAGRWRAERVLGLLAAGSSEAGAALPHVPAPCQALRAQPGICLEDCLGQNHTPTKAVT